MEERKRKNVSVLGPVLLIAIGCVLLLNTLGILEWSVWWQIFRLWPVLLIAAGLDLLIGRRSVWGSLLVTVLVLGLLVGVIWLGASGRVGSPLPAQEIQQPLGAATQAEVHIDPGVAVLRVEALPESANLVEGVVRLGRGETVDDSYSMQGGKATYELQAQGQVWVPFTGGWDDRRVWELGISPGPTLGLHTSLGMGQLLLDLTGLTLGDLEVDMGLGQTEVTLPAEGSFQGSIEGAIGLTVIIIPEGVAARIQVDTGLAGRELPDDYRQQGDGVYVSADYAEAQNRVDLQVSQAMGLLRIQH
jgi:hypothetical protein